MQGGIQMTLGKRKADEVPKLPPPAARAFDDSASSSEDEMPPEARMRMKNVGPKTPISAGGPNSFGKKAGFGFQDPRNQGERVLKQLTEELDKKEGARR